MKLRGFMLKFKLLNAVNQDHLKLHIYVTEHTNINGISH